MKQFTKNQIARGILPYAATILSLSLAVTLRIERACTDSSTPPKVAPAVLYPYSEIISSRDSAFRTVSAGAR
jgi:hypothetical protein